MGTTVFMAQDERSKKDAAMVFLLSLMRRLVRDDRRKGIVRLVRNWRYGGSFPNHSKAQHMLNAVWGVLRVWLTMEKARALWCWREQLMQAVDDISLFLGSLSRSYDALEKLNMRQRLRNWRANAGDAQRNEMEANLASVSFARQTLSHSMAQQEALHSRKMIAVRTQGSKHRSLDRLKLIKFSHYEMHSLRLTLEWRAKLREVKAAVGALTYSTRIHALKAAVRTIWVWVLTGVRGAIYTWHSAYLNYIERECEAQRFGMSMLRSVVAKLRASSLHTAVNRWRDRYLSHVSRSSSHRIGAEILSYCFARMTGGNLKVVLWKWRDSCVVDNALHNLSSEKASERDTDLAESAAHYEKEKHTLHLLHEAALRDREAVYESSLLQAEAVYQSSLRERLQAEAELRWSLEEEEQRGEGLLQQIEDLHSLCHGLEDQLNEAQSTITVLEVDVAAEKDNNEALAEKVQDCRRQIESRGESIVTSSSKVNELTSLLRESHSRCVELENVSAAKEELHCIEVIDLTETYEQRETMLSGQVEALRGMLSEAQEEMIEMMEVSNFEFAKSKRDREESLAQLVEANETQLTKHTKEIARLEESHSQEARETESRLRKAKEEAEDQLRAQLKELRISSSDRQDERIQSSRLREQELIQQHKVRQEEVEKVHMESIKQMRRDYQDCEIKLKREIGAMAEASRLREKELQHALEDAVIVAQRAKLTGDMSSHEVRMPDLMRTAMQQEKRNVDAINTIFTKGHAVVATYDISSSSPSSIQPIQTSSLSVADLPKLVDNMGEESTNSLEMRRKMRESAELALRKLRTEAEDRSGLLRSNLTQARHEGSESQVRVRRCLEEVHTVLGLYRQASLDGSSPERAETLWKNVLASAEALNTVQEELSAVVEERVKLVQTAHARDGDFFERLCGQEKGASERGEQLMGEREKMVTEYQTTIVTTTRELQAEISQWREEATRLKSQLEAAARATEMERERHIDSHRQLEGVLFEAKGEEATVRREKGVAEEKARQDLRQARLGAVDRERQLQNQMEEKERHMQQLLHDANDALRREVEMRSVEVKGVMERSQTENSALQKGALQAAQQRDEAMRALVEETKAMVDERDTLLMEVRLTANSEATMLAGEAVSRADAQRMETLAAMQAQAQTQNAALARMLDSAKGGSGEEHAPAAWEHSAERLMEELGTGDSEALKKELHVLREDGSESVVLVPSMIEQLSQAIQQLKTQLARKDTELENSRQEFKDRLNDEQEALAMAIAREKEMKRSESEVRLQAKEREHELQTLVNSLFEKSESALKRQDNRQQKTEEERTNQIRELEAALSKAQDQLTTLEKEKAELEMSLASVGRGLGAEKADLKRQINGLKKENERQKREIEVLNSTVLQGIIAAEGEPSAPEISDLKKDIRNLVEVKDDAKAKAQKLASSLQEELDQLKAGEQYQRERQKADESRELSKKLEELKEGMKSGGGEVAASKKAANDARFFQQQMDRKQDEIERLQREMKKVRDQVETATKASRKNDAEAEWKLEKAELMRSIAAFATKKMRLVSTLDKDGPSLEEKLRQVKQQLSSM